MKTGTFATKNNGFLSTIVATLNIWTKNGKRLSKLKKIPQDGKTRRKEQSAKETRLMSYIFSTIKLGESPTS